MGALELTIPTGVPVIEGRYAVGAPRALVYRAYTEPELLVRWLGPRDLTMEVGLYECRHGGRYQFIHRAPDGSEHVFRGVFHGDPTPERIVRTVEYLGAAGHLSLEDARFESAGDRTIIRTRSIFFDLADRDGMASSGMEAGMADSMRRLDELLAELQNG